ncbi:MAG: DUF4974 domain-containing protein, partial [Tannerella sp.]|nr:DUF4974 domain-containing protein [Tannerella sp.]
RAFENLLDGSEELKQTLEEVRFIWNATDELKMHKQIDAAKNWKELSRRIKVDKYKKKLWFFVRNAAALLFIPIIIISIVLFKEIQERDNVPVEQIELTSANGLVTKVILLDGSEVWLNSGSKLSYPQRFIGDTRDVFLSGEAYFKVNSNQTNRFVVSVEDGLYVSAYGTEFNVSAYKEEQTIEATLVSGNIEVGLFAGEIAGATKVLHGQQVVFNKENRQVTIADINIAVETSWKDGKMIFRRAGMKDVMRSLSRRFNVDIHLDGEELHDYEYSATFTTETLDEILYLLEKTAPIKTKIIYPEQIDDYAFTKRKVIISMRR